MNDLFLVTLWPWGLKMVQWWWIPIAVAVTALVVSGIMGCVGLALAAAWDKED